MATNNLCYRLRVQQIAADYQLFGEREDREPGLGPGQKPIYDLAC